MEVLERSTEVREMKSSNAPVPVSSVSLVDS